MKNSHNLYQCLSEAFNEAGYDSESNGTEFEFTPLNLKITPEIIKINSFENNQYSCSI